MDLSPRFFRQYVRLKGDEQNTKYAKSPSIEKSEILTATTLLRVCLDVLLYTFLYMCVVKALLHLVFFYQVLRICFFYTNTSITRRVDRVCVFVYTDRVLVLRYGVTYIVFTLETVLISAQYPSFYCRCGTGGSSDTRYYYSCTGVQYTAVVGHGTLFFSVAQGRRLPLPYDHVPK